MIQLTSRAASFLLALFSLAAVASSEELRLVQIADGLGSPTDVVYPPGDERLFVTSAEGRIWLIEDGIVRPQPFLDLSALVAPQGLMSMAFHPKYEQNGRFFVTYLSSQTEVYLVEYGVSSDPNLADPSSATVLIGPAPQIGVAHNWNCLRFGPDGMLYIATGDGGASHTENQAQDLTSLNGKVLRLDVDAPAPFIPTDNPFVNVPSVRDEIWVYGLRQPWRIEFDPANGDLYIADVGGSGYEEINFLPAGAAPAANFGWRCKEGPDCTGFGACGCNALEFTDPVHVYDHSEGCCVIGGVVYRGSEFPDLVGAYFFADHCTGDVWSLRMEQGAATDLIEHTAELAPTGGVVTRLITSVNAGPDGELLILNRTDGRMFKIASSPQDRFCGALPHTGGEAADMLVTGSGSVADNDLKMGVRRAPPGTFGIFFYGSRRTMLPFGDGFRCVGGASQRLGPLVSVDDSGAASRLIDVMAPTNTKTAIEPGATWHFQFWFRDSPGVTGFNTSDAVTVTFRP